MYRVTIVQMHNHPKNYRNRFLITMFLSPDSAGTFFGSFYGSVFFTIIIYKINAKKK